jgi:Rps23 Pro-64 3,4-dihydroxylase Tpa1-like proline 4-hydroxylase
LITKTSAGADDGLVREDRRPGVNELYRASFLKKLEGIAESRVDQYTRAEPFPHTVIDDFLPEETLQTVFDAFPQPRQLAHREFDDEQQIKLQYDAVETLPGPIREVLYFLNSSIIARFLERLTSVGGLIPDPHFVGGGLHQIERGGKLDVHADFNRLEALNLDRRLNLLIYLNPDWKEEYGGHLELWDRSMTHCVKRVLPVFNRCVVFSTTDYSYHGHPNPLTCPKGRNRKSIAMYYYTNGRPEEEQSSAHSTLFQRRPGEGTERRQVRRKVKRLMHALLPPIITDAYRHLRVSRQHHAGKQAT